MVLTPHFAHKSASSCSVQICRATREWIRVSVSSPDFVINANCDGCGEEFVAFRGGPTYTGKCEAACNTHKVDVGATSTGTSVAIEVSNTDRVETSKMKDLMAATLCKAYEVKAVDLVTTNYPTTFYTMRPLRCKLCLLSAIATTREQKQRVSRAMARRCGRQWHKKVVKINTDRAAKFGKRWLFLVRYKTTAARAKRLHDKDEADRVHTCAGCKRALETYTWALSHTCTTIHGVGVGGYTRCPEPYVTVGLNEYHPECSPLCSTCGRETVEGQQCPCGWWKRRQCGTCTQWGIDRDMYLFEIPGKGSWEGETYRANHAYVCSCCGIECRRCKTMISPAQAKYGGACWVCNSAKRRRTDNY
jgi:hypothetical protein